MTTFEFFQSVISKSKQGILELERSLDPIVLEKIVKKILTNNGRIIVTGVGKSALIGQKIVATLNSTGTPSIYMHSGDALHGDLGMVQPEDLILCISRSGNSGELTKLLPALKSAGKSIIGMTGNKHSQLAKQSDFLLFIPIIEEADILNLAPSTSSTMQLVMGDALALTLMYERGFNTDDFARVHPAGILGKKLSLKVGDLLDIHERPFVAPRDPLKKVIMEISSKRKGATAVLDDNEQILGIITDGDLRRALAMNMSIESHKAEQLMTRNPKVVQYDTLAIKALNQLNTHHINQLLVMKNEQYLGIIHIQKLIKEGLLEA